MIQGYKYINKYSKIKLIVDGLGSGDHGAVVAHEFVVGTAASNSVCDVDKSDALVLHGREHRGSGGLGTSVRNSRELVFVT